MYRTIEAIGRNFGFQVGPESLHYLLSPHTASGLTEQAAQWRPRAPALPGAIDSALPLTSFPALQAKLSQQIRAQGCLGSRRVRGNVRLAFSRLSNRCFLLTLPGDRRFF